MDARMKDMDKNKNIICLDPVDVNPVVTTANYIRVGHEGWPAHSVDNPELILVVQGFFTAQDPDHPLAPMKPGDVVMLRPGSPCDFLRTGDEEGVVSCIHFDLLKNKRYAQGEYTIAPARSSNVRAGSLILTPEFWLLTPE